MTLRVSVISYRAPAGSRAPTLSGRGFDEFCLSTCPHPTLPAGGAHSDHDGSGLSGWVRPMAVPRLCQACQTQRRTAAGCTPSARATSPTGRPAPTSPSAWTRTAVGELGHYPPPSRLAGPPEGPGAFCLGLACPRARPSSAAGARRTHGARRRRSGRGRRRCALPDGRVDGSGRSCRGSGRVGGKPGQHRSDRLGLLLVKAAASLATQYLHLDG
jgi:hypothetical protein